MELYYNASNLTTLKYQNKSLVLRVLNSQGQISRAELARITGLTKTSISNIISELMAEGIICETGTINSQSGRKPIMLKLEKDALFAIGLYISRDFAYVNIVDLKGTVITENKHFFQMEETPKSFIAIIKDLISNLLEMTKLDHTKILGIGVASIGPLDIKNGSILNPPNFRGLSSIPVVEELKSTFGFDVYLDNDMNASAIAEKLFGDAKDIANFIYVGVTNGVGAGIFLNNMIYKGSSGFAGEIGHTTININGNKCACGNYGCLELYVSIPITVEWVQSSIELGAHSILSKSDAITWDQIISAARSGDSLCLKAIDKLVYFLSTGLLNLANTFDPEIIFLGHELALAEDLILAPLNETINTNLLSRASKSLNIRLSFFKDFSPCMGAPSIVLQNFFNGIV